MFKSTFAFPPFGLTRAARAELKFQAAAVAAALAAATKADGRFAALNTRREQLQSAIAELESDDSDVSPAAAAAKLPALREELALTQRKLEQCAASLAPQAESVRIPLRILTANLGELMKLWLGRVETDWSRETAPLHHGNLANALATVRMTPAHNVLSSASVVAVRTLGISDSPLQVLADAQAAITLAGAVLGGKNPWAWVRTSHVPPA